jgi:hypothetical protein
MSCAVCGNPRTHGSRCVACAKYRQRRGEERAEYLRARYVERLIERDLERRASNGRER